MKSILLTKGPVQDVGLNSKRQKCGDIYLGEKCWHVYHFSNGLQTGCEMLNNCNWVSGRNLHVKTFTGRH